MSLETHSQSIKDSKGKEDTAKKEARLVVSIEAEAAVSELTDAVNDGFEAGRATRFDIASHMILWCKANSTEDLISEIRRQLADGFSMLDAIHKKAKSSGDLPPEVKAVLEQYFFGTGSTSQKKTKKNLKHESIIDRLQESEAS